ncbi:MAG TPA: hypothetical protein VGJ66_12965 [Pyrinomonadaceae bacterium]|jgi:hypothetical protein
MNFRYQKITTITALLVTVAVGQLYIGVTFAEPNSGASISVAAPQQPMGILTTTNNKPILVNGASAISGATIPPGATIETPENVGATIRLGALGSLCIAPNTKLTLDFNKQGNAGDVKVNLTEGCAILRTLKNTAGTFSTTQGIAGQISAATGGSIDVCLRPGGTPSVNQGSAVDAGAGASAVDCGAAGAAAIPAGIPPAATVAFIGGGAAGLYLLFRGGNPSPSAP